MCYCGCSFEAYPHGPNEGCVCRKPRGYPCPDDVTDEAEIERLNDELAYDEDEDEDDE